MLMQDTESDRYVTVAHHVPGLIMTGAFRHVARWIPSSISPFLDMIHMNSAICAALSSYELWVLELFHIYLLTRLVLRLTKTSTALWKCMHTSLNLLQHPRRSRMRATTSLALYDLFFNSVFIKYMRIYSYFPFVFQLNRVMGEAVFWPPFSFQTLRQRCMACGKCSQKWLCMPPSWPIQVRVVFQGLYPSNLRLQCYLSF